MKKKVLATAAVLLVVFCSFFQSHEAEAILNRGKWKTSYSEIGNDILAVDYCNFSIWTKECHISEARDIRVYSPKK